MRYLVIAVVCIALMIAMASISSADDSPYCLTKASLAKDVVASINDGLDPNKINFAFPNVQSEEEAEMAVAWAQEIMREVISIMQEEKDPVKVYNLIKETCKDPSHREI